MSKKVQYILFSIKRGQAQKTDINKNDLKTNHLNGLANRLARPASSSKYQKRGIFQLDFDSLQRIFPVRRLTKLRKCRN